VTIDLLPAEFDLFGTEQEFSGAVIRCSGSGQFAIGRRTKRVNPGVAQTESQYFVWSITRNEYPLGDFVSGVSEAVDIADNGSYLLPDAGLSNTTSSVGALGGGGSSLPVSVTSASARISDDGRYVIGHSVSDGTNLLMQVGNDRVRANPFDGMVINGGADIVNSISTIMLDYGPEGYIESDESL
jgi:hypothetical protein